MVEFVTLVALLCSIVLAWAGQLLKFPTEAVITASVGLTVTATLWALKWELKNEIKDKLGVYTLLEQIEDKELYVEGYTAINKCKGELDNLSKGILNVDSGQVARYLIKGIRQSKNHIRVTHVGLDEKYLSTLSIDETMPYYKENINSVHRGVTFERLFILSKESAIDHNSGHIKESINAVLKKQNQDGIKVFIVWKEELEDYQLIKDFVVIDDKNVLVSNPAWIGNYSNVAVYSRTFDIENYVSIFDSLRSRGRSFIEFEKEK